MKQTKFMSAVEATASTALGWCVSCAIYIVLSLAGVIASGLPLHYEAAIVSVVYTVASLLRGYAVRRFFCRFIDREK